MRSRSYTLAVALIAGLAVHACGAAGRAWAGESAASAAVVVARYGLDGPSAAIVDNSGRGHTLKLIAGNGGAVRSIVHGSGEALAFPPKCSGTACPHAVLQGANSPDLNPGAKPVAYGAAVLLAKNQTTKGQNVIQKGYSATSSQYKLQIDGTAGRPSCVLVDDARPTIRLVRSSVTVADGAWHTLECRRAGALFHILVDGATRGTLAVPATLSVNNTGPLSVGGKGSYRDNDQFQGALDNVWVSIG